MMTEKTRKVETCGCSESNSDEISTDIKDERIRREIRERYKNVAEGKKPLELTEEDEKLIKEAMEKSPPLYSKKELSSIPKGANLGLGSGNPVSIADIQPGETVVDLGSGAGVDCFLAANKVGKLGEVIGVDMTAKMIDLARENAYKDNYKNVEFRLGEIEHLPIADNSVDVIISNCVINLSTDKSQVFREAYRVLKPGGRLVVSDIMFEQELPEKVRMVFEGMAGCLSRAEIKEQYLDKIRNAGFDEVEIIDKKVMASQKKQVPAKENSEEPMPVTLIASGKKVQLELSPEEIEILDTAVISAHVRGVKPS
jgi:SAM-dependent methyltransferase